ncbi:MAG: Na+/H+ antiporter subunit E [Anaerolineae bacterium]|nr:Na+/H+ antiporter subunit E [Anaerolineae bacterium]MDW8300668.1 Na+/H+ antiporter subunit E [Anaerolineae bacterium]
MGRVAYIVSMSVLLSIVWMGATARVNLEGFFVGFVVSVLVVSLIGTRKSATVQLTRLPRQVFSLIGYVLHSFIEITRSSFDVARRVLDPKLPMQPGIIAVPTQDEDLDETIAALSAHAITITPGQLAVEFDGAKIMYIHCLDIASAQTADQEQAARLKMLRTILGKA